MKWEIKTRNGAPQILDTKHVVKTTYGFCEVRVAEQQLRDTLLQLPRTERLLLVVLQQRRLSEQRATTGQNNSQEESTAGSPVTWADETVLNSKKNEDSKFSICSRFLTHTLTHKHQASFFCPTLLCA